MQITMSGWSLAACIWGVVCILGYLLKISKQWVHAYRIRRGRMQMNEWLKHLGESLDRHYKDGTPYSKSAVKTFAAEVSVTYFRTVIKKHEQ